MVLRPTFGQLIKTKLKAYSKGKGSGLKLKLKVKEVTHTTLTKSVIFRILKTCKRVHCITKHTQQQGGNGTKEGKKKVLIGALCWVLENFSNFE